jgi:signal transduction histidine kinase
MITRSQTGFRWLDREAPEIAKAKLQFEEITANGYRTVAVIENIRTNFRSEAGGKSSIDLNDLILETLTLIRDDLTLHRVTVEAEPNTGHPTIFGSRIQLQQVLLNLIKNAIDAMKANGGPRMLRLTCDAIDSGDVVVSVADTGLGISPQDVDRIFHPLFTTKSDGMGMGLSICRSIVEAHGGQISVGPNKPVGTIFEFKLSADHAAVAHTAQFRT